VYKSTRVKGWWIEVRLSSIRLSSFILAGGLTPTNICAAIDAVHPWAVDVFFGVEQADAGDGEVGVGKDPRLVKRFVYAVRGEEEEDER
jgi:phosphoribosylanthranilate isomerase